MFGIGGFELFLILLFAFLIFGPDKLPALAKTVGRAIAKFRDAQAEMTEQLKLDELLRQDAASAGGAARKARSQAAGAKAPATAAPAAKEAAAEAEPEAAAQPLSFSERKARYEQERAARARAQADAPADDAAEGGQR